MEFAVSEPMTLFTVTDEGRPVALVMARDFASAARTGAVFVALGERDADYLPAVSHVNKVAERLRARRPTDLERHQWAMARQDFGGGPESEAELAGLPLPGLIPDGRFG